MTETILDTIVATKRDEVKARTARTPLSALRDQARASDRDFLAAIVGPKLSLIAEAKKKSPSKGVIRPDYDPAKIAAVYQGRVQAMSVLCDHTYFAGSLEHLSQARAACTLPVLAKDFVVDAYQLFEARVAGADAVLLMASVLSVEDIAHCLELCQELSLTALVEVHTDDELAAVLGLEQARLIGVNSRNLKTMTIEPSRVLELGPAVKSAGRALVAESGVYTRSDVARYQNLADAILVGTSLMQAEDLDAKLSELGW